jgi:hypothetical protein
MTQRIVCFKVSKDDPSSVTGDALFSKSDLRVAWCRFGAAASNRGCGGATGAGDYNPTAEAPEVCRGGGLWAQHRGVPVPSGQRSAFPVSTVTGSRMEKTT